MAESVLTPKAGGIAAAARPPARLSLRRRLNLRGPLLAGVIGLSVIILVAIAAPLLSPYDPIKQDLGAAFAAPLSPGHLLGTDNYGRDILSRILFSTRLDLQIGLFSVLFPFIVGTLIGVACGFFGGKLDLVVMRFVDVLIAFPFLVLVIAIMTLLGPGLRNLYIAVGVVGWITYARLSRGETLITRNLEYVQAARTIGCTNRRIIFAHVLPNVVGPSLIYVFTAIVQAILTGATLSFPRSRPAAPRHPNGAR